MSNAVKVKLVPQGVCPLLFLLYINDNNQGYDECIIRLFADDAQSIQQCE